MNKRLKKWTALKLRKLAFRLDKQPYAETTEHGWIILTPSGLGTDARIGDSVSVMLREQLAL